MILPKDLFNGLVMSMLSVLIGVFLVKRGKLLLNTFLQMKFIPMSVLLRSYKSDSLKLGPLGWREISTIISTKQKCDKTRKSYFIEHFWKSNIEITDLWLHCVGFSLRVSDIQVIIMYQISCLCSHTLPRLAIDLDWMAVDHKSVTCEICRVSGLGFSCVRVCFINIDHFVLHWPNCDVIFVKTFRRTWLFTSFTFYLSHCVGN